MIFKKFFSITLLVVFMGNSFVTSHSLNAQNKSGGTGLKTNKVFRAGAATSNITPFLGGGIVGNFGTPPPATYIHDELHARCLVLDDGANRLAFIVVDIIGMNRDLIDEAKRIIREETSMPVVQAAYLSMFSTVAGK